MRGSHFGHRKFVGCVKKLDMIPPWARNMLGDGQLFKNGVEMKLIRSLAIVGASTAFLATPTYSEPAKTPVYSHYGGVGLLKTRSTRMSPDSTLTTSIDWRSNQQRYALTFQAAPWLETTFSYSGFNLDGTPEGEGFFDRQFDLKVRLWEETLYMPEVAVGLQDFLGTGIFSGEYLVANKRFGPLDLSFGVGWGQLASRGVADNPFGVIADGFKRRGERRGIERTGNVNFGQYFRGDQIGVFGGVVYDTPIKNLRAIAEYDSDDNSRVGGLDDNPFNFGLVYNPSPGVQIGASLIAMDEFALNLSLATETGSWARDDPPGNDATPFHVRSLGDPNDPGPDGLIAPVQPLLFTPVSRGDLPETLRNALALQDIGLSRLQMNDDTVRLVIENSKYRSYAKAAGRATRVLSQYAPAEIETFQIAFDQKRMETAEFKLNRSQLEASAREIGYSFAPPSLSFAMITPGSQPVGGSSQSFTKYPKIDWAIGPSLRVNTFDPDDPLRVQLDLRADASVEVIPGLLFSGAVSTGIIGNFDDTNRPSDSVLPKVRSDFPIYNAETDIGIERLAVDYFFDPAPNVHAKVSAGYVERFFGGIGGELLYRPRNSRLAFGAELFYVKQRDFDGLIGFQDYDVITGHLSAYLDTTYNNWNVALHAGRYLAGDYGATLELKRRFPNGWEVGAFATLTDVPFDEFGEGSFDKGLTLSIPFDWGLSSDNQQTANVTLRPVQRDGGQRLDPGNRLFGLTQPTSQGEIASQWSTFAH